MPTGPTPAPSRAPPAPCRGPPRAGGGQGVLLRGVGRTGSSLRPSRRPGRRRARAARSVRSSRRSPGRRPRGRPPSRRSARTGTTQGVDRTYRRGDVAYGCALSLNRSRSAYVSVGRVTWLCGVSEARSSPKSIGSCSSWAGGLVGPGPRGGPAVTNRGDTSRGPEGDGSHPGSYTQPACRRASDCPGFQNSTGAFRIRARTNAGMSSMKTTVSTPRQVCVLGRVVMIRWTKRRSSSSTISLPHPESRSSRRIKKK